MRTTGLPLPGFPNKTNQILDRTTSEVGQGAILHGFQYNLAELVAKSKADLWLAPACPAVDYTLGRVSTPER